MSTITTSYLRYFSYTCPSFDRRPNMMEMTCFIPKWSNYASSHSTTHSTGDVLIASPQLWPCLDILLQDQIPFFLLKTRRPEKGRIRPWFLWGPKNQGESFSNFGTPKLGFRFSIGILFTRVPDPWVRDRFTIVIVSWLIYNLYLRDENNLYLYRGLI